VKIACACASLLAAVTAALVGAPTAAAVDFAPPTYTGLFGSPFALAVAELNGDGHPDLVAGLSSETGALVTVLLGNGQGGFGKEEQYELKGEAVFGLAVADLDGDGKPDIATALDAAAPKQEVGVMLGAGGDAFGGASYFEAGEHPIGIAAGHFTGGALPDLAVADEVAGVGTVSLLVNKSTPGKASFAAPKQFTAPGAFALAVADFNRDGIPDLAVADTDEGKSGYTILDGTGTASGFSTPKFTALGENLLGVATGDFNGDGYPDLTFVDDPGFGRPSRVWVALNNKVGGFEAAVAYDVGHGAESVAVGEVEGDGRPDLLVAEDTGEVLVLHNDGNGTFTEAGRFPAGSGVGPLLTADLTGNGAEDIIDGDQNSTVATLLNIGQASPSPSSLTFGTVTEGEESAPQTVTIANTGAAPMTIEGLGLAGVDPGDFDLDDAGLVLGAGTCSGVALAPGAACTANVALRPAQTGALGATLLVFTDTGAAPASIALSGTGAPRPLAIPVPATRPPTPQDSALKLSRTSFAPLSHGASIAAAKSKRKKPPQGTRLSYSDTLPATSTFAILGLQRGYRVAGKGSCKAPSAHGKPPRHSASCTRAVKLGSFTHGDVAGSNSFTFSGRLNGKPLAAGGYELEVTPKLAGLAGKTLSTRFTVV
jgi:hypothetical protein